MLTLTAFHIAALAGAALLLIAAAVSDARQFRIPNRICLALALLFPLFAFTAPQAIEWGQHIIVFGLLLAAGYLMFLTNLAGAGDIKLLATTGLWAGPHWVAVFVLTTALAGGLLAVGVGLLAWLRKSRQAGAQPINFKRLPLPYGIAIATGGLSVIYRLSQPLLFPV